MINYVFQVYRFFSSHELTFESNVLIVNYHVQECVHDIKKKQFYQIFKLITTFLWLWCIYTSFEDCYNMWHMGIQEISIHARSDYKLYSCFRKILHIYSNIFLWKANDAPYCWFKILSIHVRISQEHYIFMVKN